MNSLNHQEIFSNKALYSKSDHQSLLVTQLKKILTKAELDSNSDRAMPDKLTEIFTPLAPPSGHSLHFYNLLLSI